MDSPQEKNTATTKLPSSFRLVMTLAVVAMLSGFLVVLVYEYTKPIIAENQRLATERAIYNVLPDAKSRVTFRLNNGKIELADDQTQGELLYAGYDADNQFVGMALNAAAQGYQGIIRLLYGYQPQKGCITGFDVLKSTETPGFGTKISNDPAFLANFNCLSAKVDEEHKALQNVIITKRHGTKEHPWEIDAISGSTITSNAIGRMLNQSGQKLHPVIARHFDWVQSIKQVKGGRHEPVE